MSSDTDTDCTSASANCHFTCPSGGTWYVCPHAPYFVGCCSSDPCNNSNTTSPCPDVYPASYDASAFGGTLYDSIRPNNCIGGNTEDWYTCNFTQPTFLGCCASSACASDGCPERDLLPAAWSASRGDQFTLFQDLESDDGDGDDLDGLSGGAIAGIVVGVVAGIVILLAAWWFWRRKRRAGKTGKIGFTPEGGLGHGRSVSEAEGEVQRMYTGEYGYQNPNSPYQDSHFSSPAATVTGTPNLSGPNSKYPSGFSAPSLSPPLPSEGGRPISEISGSDEYHPGHHRGGSGGQHGLGVFGAQKPPTIQELDDTARPAEVHELDNTSRK